MLVLNVCDITLVGGRGLSVPIVTDGFEQEETEVAEN